MREVGIRDLKNRLSEYLRAVDHGEVILVTVRGRPVAEIGKPFQPPPGWEELGLSAQFWEMVARGTIHLGKLGPQEYEMPPGPGMPAGTAQELIDWDRDEDDRLGFPRQ